MMMQWRKWPSGVTLWQATKMLFWLYHGHWLVSRLLGDGILAALWSCRHARYTLAGAATNVAHVRRLKETGHL